MKTNEPDASATSRKPASRSRRVYQDPKLIEYGPVVKLTQGTRTVRRDGPMGGHRRMAMMMCL